MPKTYLTQIAKAIDYTAKKELKTQRRWSFVAGVCFGLLVGFLLGIIYFRFQVSGS